MLNHLLELRRRALYILIAFMIFFLSYFYFAADLFYLMIKPLLATLPDSSTLIATQITSPVFTPLKLAFNLSLLSSVPIALYHVWHFAAPGLYKKEKDLLRAAISLSMLLFIAGAAFCFTVVLPFMFYFFTQALPQGVKLLPDMSYTLDFITKMMILFGLCFQVPLINVVLVRLGLFSVQQLKAVRPYFIVFAFTAAMILTPPDVFSQVILALPLCLLNELGIFLAGWIYRLKPS